MMAFSSGRAVLTMSASEREGLGLGGGHGGGSEPLGAPGSAASSSPGWGPAGRPPRGTCRGTRGCEIVPPRCTAPDRGQHASSAPKRRGLGGPGVFCWCCSAPKATAPQPRAPGAAYPRRPASWGCPGTSPPPRRRCSGWSRGRPGGRETLGGRPGLVAHGSVPAGGKGRGRAVGRGRAGRWGGAGLHLPQLVVLNELRPVPVDQGVEGEAVLPAARGDSEGGSARRGLRAPQGPSPTPLLPPERQRGREEPL